MSNVKYDNLGLKFLFSLNIRRFPLVTSLQIVKIVYNKTANNESLPVLDGDKLRHITYKYNYVPTYSQTRL